MLASELLALAAASCIALSGMLIGELNGRVDIVRLTRWQLTAAFVMTAAMSLALGGWRALEPWQVTALVISGFFGILVASTTYYAAIFTAGPQLTALLFSLASPFALALGYLVLGETVSPRQGGGILLVLAGIVLAIGPPGRPPAQTDRSSRKPVLGIGLGVVTAFGQALGSLVARPAMASGVEPFTAMAVRLGLASGVFLVLAAAPHPWLNRPYRFRAADFGLAAASAFLGAGLGMSLLMAALARGDVGVVSTLSSMTPVVILPMVWLRSGAPPAPRAWVGAGLAVAGTALISL